MVNMRLLRHSKKDLIVAISGGHSSSVAFAFSVETGPMGVATHKGINPHLMSNEALSGEFVVLMQNLASAMMLEREELFERISHIAMACPGAATIDDQTLIEIALNRVLPRWKSRRYSIYDDTWAGLAAGAQSLRGTCAFAGTGASVYVGNGKAKPGWGGKFDGWGFIIGDFGSGFQTVIDMLRQFCRHWNEHGEQPQLFERICEYMEANETGLPHLASIEGTQKWFDIMNLQTFRQDWRINLAKLATVITREASTLPKDSLAKGLIEHSAAEMLKTIKTAMVRNPIARNQPLVLQGGMFEHSELYRDIVINGMRTVCQSEVFLSKYRPVLGATLLFLAEHGIPMKSRGRKLIDSWLSKLKSEQLDLLGRRAPATFFGERK